MKRTSFINRGKSKLKRSKLRRRRAALRPIRIKTIKGEKENCTEPPSLLRRKPTRSLRACGKKAKYRESINAPNRIRFAAMGLLDVCEARLPGCWPNGDLTWAHGKKDRFLTEQERTYLVIRCCTVCHHRLDEEMSHEAMLLFVQGVIEARKEVA